MAIVPDDKDWTWVLERACPECGFDATTVTGPQVAAAVRAGAARWRALVDHPLAGARPREDRWSAQEYACHVRDMLRLALYRIGRMLDEDEPAFDNWDQDRTAEEDRYAEQPIAGVLVQLEDAGEALATRLDHVPDGAWSRSGTRSDGAVFTVDTFARYALHDLVHHVWDVGQDAAVSR